MSYHDFLVATLGTATTFQERADIILALEIPIIPLSPGKKDPCTAHGVLDASTDLAVVARWAELNPTGNVGAAARFDGSWFLDDDAGTLAETAL